jgi:transcriptional regulator with XRE-family HTH domain
MTQKQLAEKVGVIRQAVGNWEAGWRMPDAETLCLLADFFNVSVDYLLGRTDTPSGVYVGRVQDSGGTEGELSPADPGEP